MGMIGPYSRSIRQHHIGGDIINYNGSLACMTMFNPTMGWFEIVEVLTYDLDEITGGNY